MLVYSESAWQHAPPRSGPFTLDGAEAVAGPGAEAAVLHLVDCSLVVPPRPGADGRPR